MTKKPYPSLAEAIQIPIIMGCGLFISFVLIVVYGKAASDKTVFDELKSFTGKGFWASKNLQHCDTTTDKLFRGQYSHSNLHCYVFQLNLNFVKTEVLNINPPLVKYHQFFTKEFTDEFLSSTELMDMRELLVKSKDGPDRNVQQQSRVANGTFLPHYSTNITTYAYNYIQNRVNALNFAKAEDFQVLSYSPGGHYAPHYDHFNRNYDIYTKGNRFATFMAILKAADVGGGTIYPTIGVTFQPKAGDAVVWLNMDPDYGRAEGSLHGACPVVQGVKVGLTLWVRSKGQELRWLCPLKEYEPFSADFLVKPKWQTRDWPLKYGLPLFS